MDRPKGALRARLLAGVPPSSLVKDLERLVAAERGRPLAETPEAVRAGVRRHGPQLDDQTLLLIRTL